MTFSELPEDNSGISVPVEAVTVEDPKATKTVTDAVLSNLTWLPETPVGSCTLLLAVDAVMLTVFAGVGVKGEIVGISPLNIWSNGRSNCLQSYRTREIRIEGGWL